MQRNVLTAVFDGGFDCIAEAAAAGYSHPCDGDGPDIVVLKNLRQLLGVIHRIQLGAADHGHLMDVYLFCTDGLCGMMQAIEAVYPKSRLQRCIVHQIRSSTKYVSYKDIKQVVADLKKVYTAVTLEEAEANLESFAAKWRKQYPSCVKSWEENWEVLSTFFEYPQEIRKIIYTTNIIEGLNRQFRQITKNKPSFTNDDSLRRMLYLASQRIVKHWHARCQNWDLVLSQLEIMFADRRAG